MRPPPRPPQRIRLEELNGASQELDAPWRVARPWKFTHVDGREFEASRKDGDIWIYRTRQPTQATYVTLQFTRGEACCVVGSEIWPTTAAKDLVQWRGHTYERRYEYPDHSINYHCYA